MSGIERVEYMDNIRSAVMTENILKERKIQRNYFKDQEAKGRVVAQPPTPPTVAKSLLETVGVPEHIHTLRLDPEQSMNLTLSKNMWTANPGYLVRDGPKMASTMKRDYVYDQEELELMKQQGFLDKTYNRRRDEFVMYVEASAKMSHLMKGPGQGAH